MYLIKNSLKNLLKHRSKYRPIAILYLVIVTVLSLCVSTYFTMDRLTDNILTEYAGLVRIDASSLENDPTELRPTRGEYLSLGEVDGVSEAKIYKYNFFTEQLRAGASPVMTTLNIDGVSSKWGNGRIPIRLHGCDLSMLHLEYEKMPLEAGRMIERDGEAVLAMNRELPNLYGKVDWNQLEIGDKVIFESGDLRREFEIVGILAQNESDGDGSMRYELYTTLADAEYFDRIALENYYTTTINLRADGVQFLSAGYEAVLYLDDPNSFRFVSRKLAGMGYSAKTFFADAWSMLNLTRSLKLWCVVFTAVIGAVIIFTVVLSTNILLGSRKYDIAVLRSMGMSKGRLILGFLIENLAFIWSATLVSILLSRVILPFVQSNVFSELAAMVSDEVFTQLISGGGLVATLAGAGIVFGVMTLAVGFALVITIVNIVRFEPLKIFTRQY